MFADSSQKLTMEATLSDSGFEGFFARHREVSLL